MFKEKNNIIQSCFSSAFKFFKFSYFFVWFNFKNREAYKKSWEKEGPKNKTKKHGNLILILEAFLEFLLFLYLTPVMVLVLMLVVLVKKRKQIHKSHLEYRAVFTRVVECVPFLETIKT